MKLLPEHRPLTGMEAGMVIVVTALIVVCCLGVTALSLIDA